MPDPQNCDLAASHCVPCKGGSVPMAAPEARKLLAALPGWELAPGAASISRRFTFKNFKQSLAFVNKVGEIAEKEGHHPDITFGWGYTETLLTTHAIKGLHQNDFIMASKISALENS